MDIFGHLIQNEKISGIGPLMLEQHPDVNMIMLNGTCRYFFELHLTGHTTKISSNWLNLKTDGDDISQGMQWREQYHIYRKEIADRFCEQQPMITPKEIAQ